MLNVKPVKLGTTERMSFSALMKCWRCEPDRGAKKLDQWFLDEGLKEVFRDMGPVEDYTATWCWISLATGWILNQIQHQGV